MNIINKDSILFLNNYLLFMFIYYLAAGRNNTNWNLDWTEHILLSVQLYISSELSEEGPGSPNSFRSNHGLPKSAEYLKICSTPVWLPVLMANFFPAAGVYTI